MDVDKIRELIRQPEGLKLDFKREFYKIDHADPDVKKRQWGELIKDVLALLNGNVNCDDQPAYLVIGVGDKLGPDGNRDLTSVDGIDVSQLRMRLLDKVNEFCSPPMPDIQPALINIDGFSILVISLPFSPHLHATTRILETSGKGGPAYRENTVFIRRAEGIAIATIEEIEAIRAEKKRVLSRRGVTESDLPIGLSSRGKTSRSSLPQFPPMSPADFVGRADELNRLVKAIGDGQRGVIIWGSGGIGKTTLATKLMERIQGKFPDGTIYFDLKGVGVESPPAVSKIAADVIHWLEPQRDLPADEFALIDLYRSVVFEKKIGKGQAEQREPRLILLFMDNAADADQLEPLVPPPGSIMLITSRQYFSLRGFYPLALETLPHGKAVSLLKKLVTHLTNTQADTLAALCDDYPFALTQAGGSLAKSFDTDVDEYIEQLRDGKSRVGLIESALRLSYEPLGKEAQQQWRVLGLFPASFDLQASTSVWGLEIAAAKRALSYLVNRSLIRYNRKTKRYQLLDLHREFALQQLTADERAGVERRHAFYFLETAISAAHELYLGDEEAEKQAVDLFEWDWPNYQVAWAWASEQAESNILVARLCYRYLDIGWHLIIRRRPANEWIEWLEQALTEAKQSEDVKAELRRTYRLATAYESAHEYSQVVSLYERALALARTFDAQQSVLVILLSLGKAMIRDLQLERIASYVPIVVSSHYGHSFGGLGKAVLDLENIPDKVKRAGGLVYSLDDDPFEDNATGEIDVSQLRQQAAIAVLQSEHVLSLFAEATDLARKLGDEWRELDALIEYGKICGALCELYPAIEKYEQALALARKLDAEDAGEVIWKLGGCYTSLGHHFFYAQDWHQAIECYERRMALFDGDDEYLVDTSALHSLTLALIHQENWKVAQERQIRLEQHLFWAVNYHAMQPQELCDMLWELGKTYVLKGRQDRALNQFRDCVDFALQCHLVAAHDYLTYLVDVFFDADELPEAIDYCRGKLREYVEYASDDATYSYYDSLSWQIVLIYERMGKYEKAIADADQCVEWDIEADRSEAGEHIAYLESLRVQWASQQRGKQ